MPRTVESIIRYMESTGVMMKNMLTSQERFDQLVAYQALVVNEVFSDTHGQSLRLTDVIKHFKDLAESKGLSDSSVVCKAISDMELISREIAGAITGAAGEKQVERSLIYSERKFINLSNITLSDDVDKTEIDQIVITSNGILILEVKNIRHDVVITESGQIYGRKDKTLGEQMNIKRYLLRTKLAEVLAEVDPTLPLHIESRVVFCDPTINIRDYYHGEKYCFKAKLPYEIDHFYSKVTYTPLQMQAIATAVKEIADTDETYPIKLDFNEIRRNFAEALILLEKEIEINHNACPSEALPERHRRFPLREISIVSSVLAIAGTVWFVNNHNKNCA